MLESDHCEIYCTIEDFLILKNLQYHFMYKFQMKSWTETVLRARSAQMNLVTYMCKGRYIIRPVLAETVLVGFVPASRSVYKQKVPVMHSVSQYSPTPGASAPLEIIFSIMDSMRSDNRGRIQNPLSPVKLILTFAAVISTRKWNRAKTYWRKYCLRKSTIVQIY